MKRFLSALTLCTAACALLSISPAWAAYPDRPVTLVVPFVKAKAEYLD
jgi:tripartite-type tricarboxylate transporter receptor subunit TctC